MRAMVRTLLAVLSIAGCASRKPMKVDVLGDKDISTFDGSLARAPFYVIGDNLPAQHCPGDPPNVYGYCIIVCFMKSSDGVQCVPLMGSGAITAPFPVIGDIKCDPLSPSIFAGDCSKFVAIRLGGHCPHDDLDGDEICEICEKAEASVTCRPWFKPHYYDVKSNPIECDKTPEQCYTIIY